MAEEVIGLRIQLNGMNTVIQDVETFEMLLKEAREDLKQIPIGSNNFKQLQQEISKAEKQLGTLNNTQKQSRKEIEQFRQGTEMLSKAFQGAFAALTLFGNESESVTQAQKIASQALTVVIAAQTVSQIQLGEATIATTIATRAQTIATNTSNTAMKALFTTIAANPVGALVAVIGLAVAAFMSLSDSVEESKDELETFTKTYNTELQKLSVATKINVGIVNDVSKSIELRKEKLDELNKAFPEQFKNLDKEKILNGELKVSYDELVKSIERTARAKAVNAQLDVTSERIVAVEQDLRNKRNELKQLEKSLVDIESGTLLDRINIFNVLGQVIGSYKVSEVAAQISKLKTEITDLSKEQKNLTTTQKNLINQAIELAKATNKETKGSSELTDEQKRLIKAYEDRLAAQNDLIEQLGELNDLEIEYVDNTIEAAKKTRDELNKLLTLRREFYTTESKKFLDEINDVFFEALSPQEFNKFRSAYLAGFDLIFNSIKDSTLSLVDEQGKAISFSFDNIKNIIDKSNLPDDIKKTFGKISVRQQEALAQLFTNLAQTAEKFSQEIKIGDKIITPLDKDTAQKNLLLLLDGVKNILADQDILPGQEVSAIKKLIESIFVFPTKTAEDFKNQFDETGEVGLKLYNEGIETLKNNLIDFALVQSDSVKGFDKLKNELSLIVNEVSELNTELAETAVITDEKLNIVIDKLRAKIGSNTQLLNVFLQDVATNTEKYVETFTEEGLLKIINGLTGGLGDIKTKTKEELVQLLAILLEARRTIETEFGEGTAKAFTDLIDAIQNRLKELPTTADDEFKKTLDKIETSIRQLQQVLGSIGQLFSDSFTFELEKLETNYNRTLDGIVGDTKEANEKRIELEKGYQKEKKELEKQARLTSLRITLAETLAAGAQSVVTALTIPGAGPFLAALNGSIAAAQALLVAQQIEYVSSLRRGGKLAAGGVVFGPSHENGGVKYMNGGVELEGNEAVINRNSTIQYGSLLSSINQAQGGRPILVGNAMDSRLIEVLAKQKQEPIRAYVLESDISKSQQINRKLEQLASF